MICQHCGKVLDNDKLVYCVVCGYPLKSSRGFFARSEEPAAPPAEEYTPPQPEPVLQPAPAQPVMPQPTAVQPIAPQPIPAQPVQPVSAQTMQPVAAQPMAAQPMMQQPMAQPVVQPVPQQGVPVMPQYPMGMQQPVQPVMQQPVMPQPMAQPMMMPQQPVMPVMQPMQPEMPESAPVMMGYPMQQMQYGMPQFAGYDPAGNPIYVQMVPQIMGYDPYGNPLYTMVPMHCQMPMQNMVTPQVPMMQPSIPQVMVQPPVMDVPAVPVQEYVMPAEQPVMPVQPVLQQPVTQPVQEPLPVQEAPVQEALPKQEETPVREEHLEITSAEDIPVSADTLMEDSGEEQEAQAGTEEMPDEEALLSSIFSDAPKSYSMSSDVKPGTATFSINVSASEITSVRDEEAPSPEPAKSTRKKAEPKEEKKEEKKTSSSSKKKAAPAKKPQPKIISPDEFFDDKPKAARGTLAVPAEIDKLDDEQLVEQLAAMQQQATGKKSHRTMKAASEEEIDLTNAVQEVSGTKPTLPN